jgi:hypothetical protein
MTSFRCPTETAFPLSFRARILRVSHFHVNPSTPLRAVDAAELRSYRLVDGGLADVGWWFGQEPIQLPPAGGTPAP